MRLAMGEPVTERCCESVEGLAAYSVQESELAALNRKLDQLTAQVAFLAEEAENARRQRLVWSDLQADLSPVVRDLYAVAEEEMVSLRPHVELDDLLFFARRLARNVRTFNEMLDQLESAKDFLADAAPLTREMIDEVTGQLDQMERKGYFGFLRQGMYIADQIVTSFSEEEVRQLGDNVVLILKTVKALTQPEIMHLANNLTSAFAEVEGRSDQLPTSLFGLLGQMRDPEVRQGLAVTMEMLKVISRQRPARK